jgi:uncharacterized protein YodC (DUF2158 family)
MTTTKQTIEQVAADLGLTMDVEFVPWSQSRNKGEKQPSLNWKVTLKKGGRAIVTTDYGAGMGHCPAYKASVKELGNQNSIMRDEAVRWECEHGKKYKLLHSVGMELHSGKTILPELADVLHSLASDADVIDSGTFEEWAGNLGYDTDSRKAEGIYRACLDIALKLRNALGEDGLAKLREAVQDY